MTWGAHKTDVRIAAKNSVQVRAALRVSINAEKIYEAYQDTHPYVSDNITQDRARARAWAMLHVKIDNAPIEAALKKVYTDGFLLGLDASKEAIGKEVRRRKAENKAANPYKDELLDMAQGDGTDYVDWANWKPGNRAAALLYRPTGAFEKILADAGIVSKNIAKAGYDRIGTALADSIAAGFSPGKAAKIIALKVSDPARALTIAVTEQNRAMSLASMQNYKNYGVEKVEWSGANPCDLCAPNEGQVVALGEQFESGDTEPPVHPNCRCALLPVINEEFDAEPDSSGMNLMDIEATAPTAQTSAVENARNLTLKDFKQLGNGQLRELGELDKLEYKALHRYKGIDYQEINGYLRQGIDGMRFPGINPAESAASLQLTADRVSGVIARTTPITEPIITFRGLGGTFAEKVWEGAPGSTWVDKGFSSTSNSLSNAESFSARLMLKVINPAGTKGLAIEEVIDVSGLLVEREWLLPTNTTFKIISKETTETGARYVTVEVIQ